MTDDQAPGAPVGWPTACLAHVRSITTFGVAVDLAANRPDVLERVLATAPPGAEPGGPVAASVAFGVRAAGACSCGRVHDTDEAWRGDQPLRRREPDLASVLDVVRGRLKTAVATAAPDLVFVHAGAVAWNGRAAILPGHSHAGKSTLVRSLLEAGATYLSDDLAPIDAGGRVHPYPQPLGIRAAPAAPQRSVEVVGAVATGPVPLGLVVLTAFEPGARWRPVPMARSEAVLTVVAHSIALDVDPSRAMATISDVLDGIDAHQGPRGEADEVAAWILERLGTARRPPDPDQP